MPMYFPDLNSVKRIAIMMKDHPEPKKYKGIIPQTESELPVARQMLGKYFREVWHDEVQALEIEEAVTKEDYEEKLSKAILRRLN